MVATTSVLRGWADGATPESVGRMTTELSKRGPQAVASRGGTRWAADTWGRGVGTKGSLGWIVGVSWARE